MRAPCDACVHVGARSGRFALCRHQPTSGTLSPPPPSPTRALSHAVSAELDALRQSALNSENAAQSAISVKNTYVRAPRPKRHRHEPHSQCKTEITDYLDDTSRRRRPPASAGVDCGVFLSFMTGMQNAAGMRDAAFLPLHPPARSEHLRLSGGAAGAMDKRKAPRLRDLSDR